MAAFSQFSRCLWCIWPALVIGIGWFMFYRPIDGKTYYAALPVGKDPLSPACQDEFETTRQRDKEKRTVIFWCVGIIALGYVAALLYNTFTVSVKSSELTSTPLAQSLTWTPEVPPTMTPLAPVNPIP